MKRHSLFPRAAVNVSITYSVIVLFLILTGFTTALVALLARFLGGKPDVGQLPAPLYLGILLALFGFACGSSAVAASRKQNQEASWVIGFFSSLLTGLVVALFLFVIGSVYAGGADFRNYLSALGPDIIQFLLYNQSPLVGAGIHVGVLAIFGLLGGLWAYGRRPGGMLQKGSAIISSQVSRLSGLRRFLSNRYVQYGLFAFFAVAAFFLPRTWGSYWNYVIGLVGIYILLGLGLNIIVGLSGQLVLGYVAFFAIGAYTVALLNAPIPHNLMWGFWIALILGIILATISGILVGLPIMRLRGDYLAIVTLGFGEIIRILLKSDMLTKYTGGPRGVQDIKGPEVFGIPFSSDVEFMYLILAAVVIGLFLAVRLQHSRVGRAWVAIREDETVAQASGVNTTRYKLLALALGAALAGFGGVIFASRNQFTGPEDHGLMVSINVLCIVIVGGMGSIPGVVLGAFILKGLPELLREVQTYRLLVFGALLVLMMIIRPQGLWPAARDKLVKEDQDKTEAQGPTSDPEEVK